MSGIYGYVQPIRDKNEEKIDINKLKLWNQSYGKDDCGLTGSDDFSLGCCYEKLSIYANKNGVLIKRPDIYAVIDAVLYNRDELIKRVDISREVSDEELLYLYIEKYGLKALVDINGDFAGAIYDKKESKITLFRDHMGIRPLFYYVDDSKLVFSTDIRGIIAVPQANADVSKEWIFKTACGFVVTDREKTEFENIFCVSPGGYINFQFEDGSVVVDKKKYWEIGIKKIRFSSENEYKDRLRELITDSIKRRLDVIPGLVGAELSGGLDSGVIDILINRLGRDAIYFSWSASPERVDYVENDERLVINDICAQENITCEYIGVEDLLGPDSNIALNMQEMGYDLDYTEDEVYRYIWPPYVNTTAISTTSQHINRRGAKVVFSGHGGDEGVSHRSSLYELFYYREFYHFFKQLYPSTEGKNLRLLRTLKRGLEFAKQIKKEADKPFTEPFYAPELLRRDFASRFNEKDMPKQFFSYDPVKYIKSSGSRNRLDNVAIQGAFSGVRYIVPYLDYRVVDFAVSIPRHMYIKGSQNRYIFRETFKDIMPQSLYVKTLKESFGKAKKEKKENWFEDFAKTRKILVEKFDREYWGQYLDYGVIDKWLEEGEPTEEARVQGNMKFFVLFRLSIMQNLIDKVRR